MVSVRLLLHRSFRLVSKMAELPAHASQRLIWIDCEMTGLDDMTDSIVEIACIVTEGDRSLTQVDDGVRLVVHQPASVLQNMNEWCKTHFKKNGLFKEIQQSTVSMSAAEQTVLHYVRRHTPPKVCALAGNTVSMDRRFIDRQMPSLGDHFHYRTVDVSTLKELCRRWYPDAFSMQPPKQLDHRALDDIRESIRELRWYQEHILRQDIS